MAIKKSLLAAALVLSLGASGIILTSNSSAASARDSLIAKLATKFNVDESEIEAVFDEFKDERQADLAAEVSDDLQDRVDSGDITAEQKTAIEEKLAEIQAERETNREELEAWADENGIDYKYLMGGHGPRGNDSSFLDDAVEDGDITEEQKAHIETKRDELEANREAERDALETWADENGINLEDMMLGRGRHGFGHGMMF